MAADDRPAAGQSGAAEHGSSNPTGAFPALIGLARRSVLVSALIGLAALLITGFALMELRNHHVESTLRGLQHIAYGLAEQTARQITEADRNLVRITDAARLQPELLQDREQRNRVLQRNLSSIAQASAILYVEPNGQRHYYARTGGRGTAASFPLTGLKDGLTVIDGTGKNPSGLFLQRTVAFRGTAAGGAVIIRMSEHHLAELYNAWRGQSGVSVSLTSSENRPLLQHPDAPLVFAKAPMSAGNGDSGRFVESADTRFRNPSDKRDYLIVSRGTPGYPLVVHTAVPQGEALEAWTAQGSILVAAVVTLVIIMLVMARRHAAELSRRAAAVDQMQHLQDALAAEEAKLQAMFKTALESVIVIDERGIIERVNPAAERMFGYCADELAGQNVSMLMPKPDRDKHDGYLQRYVRTGTPHIIGSSGRELTAIRKDGSEFRIKLGVAEQRLAGVRRFTGTVRDITQEKLAEALLHAETRIAAVLSSARTVDQVANEVVAALCDLGFVYGQWTVRDALTRDWRVRGHALTAAMRSSDVAPLATGASGPGAEGPASRAWQTAQVVWQTHLDTLTSSPRTQAAVAAGFFSCVAVPVRSGQEVVAAIELFSVRHDPRSDTLDNALRNIGLQVGQLLSRLQAEEQLQKIVRTVPSAVFQARVGERRTIALTFMSGQVEALWGVSAKSVLARPRHVLWKIPPAYRRDLLRALSRAVIRGGGWDVTVPIMKDDGLRWLRVHANPAYKKGEAPVWDGIISDVTDQKVAEQQVVRLNLDLERRVEERTQQLAAVNKELEAFSDSVSHDLRAPLRGIRSYAEMLKQSELVTAPDALVMVERIVTQGSQMESLIEALLELSQISRHEVRRKETDVSGLARTILDNLQAREPNRRVECAVHAGVHVNADARLLRSVFENLLSNAWKFTRNTENARIEVGAVADSPDTLYVRDNGAGFDPAYADKLFQPFQRLHPASQFEGTGIGLATVQRIIRRHGGRIWAVSKPGEGATFFFEFSAEGDASLASRA
jgi:PAS domain S-box-containing protein